MVTKAEIRNGPTLTTPLLDNPWVLTTDNIVTDLNTDETPIPDIIRGHSAIREVALTETTYRSLGMLPTQALLHKTDDNPDREYSHHVINPLQIEVTGTNFFRLLASEHCSRAYLIVNPRGIADSCVIERIPGFRTLDQIHAQQELALTKEDILRQGITSVLIYNFLLQNNDFRNGNIGLANGRFMAIDFDQALWSYPTCALFDTPLSRVTETKLSFDTERFPLTLRDIQNFPVIQDAKPSHWPARDIPSSAGECDHNRRDQAFVDLLKSLKDDPEFIEQKYFCLFKFIILFRCKAILASELAKSMHPASQPFKIIIDNLYCRALQLQYLLIADKKFEPYFQKTAQWFEKIKETSLQTHPQHQLELTSNYHSFKQLYNAGKQNTDIAITHARNLAERTQSSPERHHSLQHARITSEFDRQMILSLATMLTGLLEKHKKYIIKADKTISPKKSDDAHRQHKTVNFCQNMITACQRFDTSTLNQLFEQTPKVRLGFFNWFFGSSAFKRSLHEVLKSDMYQKVQQHVKKRC